MPSQSESAPDPLLVAVNSARTCVERFRVRSHNTDLLSTALRELDDAMDLLGKRDEPQQWTVRLEKSNGGSPGREHWDTRDWTGPAMSEDEAIGKALRAFGLNDGWRVERWGRPDA